MRPLSRIGMICLAFAALLILGTFLHYGGMEQTSVALARMIGTLFWGAILWGGILTGLMAILFLGA